MATFVLLDARLEVNSVNLSTAVRQVTLTTSADAEEDTAMGDTYRSRLGGLKDWNVEVEFNQDFAASQVDATLFPLLGTVTTVKVRATSGAITATNPEFSGSAILTEYPPIAGSVGEVTMVSATFEGASTLTRATS